MVPPVYLIPRTLAYMYNQGAKGTLVVPLRKFAFFWTMLSNVYYTFIQDLRVLSLSKPVTRPQPQIIEVCSMKFEWHTSALKIVKICYEHIVHLDIEWVPRNCNTRAGFISKLIDFDDYQVTEDVFKDLGSLLGPHTVDCSATCYNRKIVTYFSRLWNPDTSGIDAFIQSWKVENSRLVPLVSYSLNSCLYV